MTSDNTTQSDDMRSSLPPDLVRELFDLADKMRAAPHGETRTLAAGFATAKGKNVSTIYTWLKRECGYETGRKMRADKGSTRLPEETLHMIAAAKREAMRGNGKAIMPTGVAMNVADTNGLTVNVSSGRVNALLRQNGMRAKQLASARDTMQLRSLHPNHVHQIDPSLCVLYYALGKQHIMDAEVFYKNKMESYAKVKLKMWRYVCYDHASGTLTAYYYEAAGENQHSLFEFLQYAWSKQERRLSHGVPKRLLWDKGSANTSGAIRNLLDALGVIHETHAAHHANAKGGVESGNRIVETHFESRLKIEPVDTVEELNAAVTEWARAYNANQIKHVDCRIERASGEKFIRDDLWHKIRADELKLMPSEAVCRWFFHANEQTRVVRNLEISFKHPELDKPATYKLHDWAQELTKGEQVRVLPLLGMGGTVRILIERLGGQAPLAVQVSPVANFDEYGRDAAAQVIGEGYTRAPDSATVTAAKKLNQLTYGVTDLDEADKKRTGNARPFAALNDGKGLVAHSHLKDAVVPTRLERKGSELDTTAIQAARATQVELPKLTHTQAAIQLRGLLGRNLEPGEFSWIKQRFADGVPSEQVEALAQQFSGTAPVIEGDGTHGGGLRRVK